MADYVRNAWYVAAWEEEVPGDHWLPRRLLDTPRLIFRKRESDGYVMLADRCPHRFAPLHLGKREGDTVVCGYHGLGFDATGACVAARLGTPPTHVHVESIPLVARHGLLWFWAGDPLRAEPSDIPDFSYLDSQNVFRRKSTFEGNYELLSDNLMDLSHVDLLHAATFGTQDTMSRATHKVYDGERDTIWSDWKISDSPKLPFLGDVLQGLEKIDHLARMRWSAPASMSLELFWMAHEGRPDQAVFSMVNPHIITPESPTRSHYFWTCQPDAGSERLARAVFETEDRPMIEGVQRMMGDADFWQMKPAVLKQDLAAIRVRRRLIKLRHDERAGPVEPSDDLGAVDIERAAAP